MNFLEKMYQIGRGYSYNSFIVYEIKGNVGRVIITVTSLKEAEEYVRIGKKQGMELEIAEYDVSEDAIYNY